ncbi:hypothetical protein PAF15_01380 [Weissella koreensis]|uniref:hypothetical protein n=1 Tax=Weissella koreensis TaxID=165096 RepID=UPI0022BA5F7F|nr:hypothetical protein [Weissella koreensis]MCZ9310629.1 hypothetical protein [Weissella koreensis]
MTKHKVSQALMDELDSLKAENVIYPSIWRMLDDIAEDTELRIWLYDLKIEDAVTLQREQAVIDYVFNDADNFEVKTPTWVIVSKEMSDHEHYHFLFEDTTHNMKRWRSSWGIEKDDAINNATRITDPKLKDALLYANKDFEAIEVEE